MTEPIRLTTFAAESGSAARRGPCDLQAVPDALPRSSPEFGRMRETRDDAAVACVSDDLCLVQMVDFFTAIVDTPYWFGQLAAGNALSDVNAMGARSLTAMNTIGSVEASLVGPLMVEALA